MTDGVFEREIWALGYGQLRSGTEAGAWPAVSIPPPPITVHTDSQHGHELLHAHMLTRRKLSNEQRRDGGIFSN